MEKEKRALSWNEFVGLGFDGRDYKYPDFEGDFIARMDCKRWGSKKNLVAYFTLRDGRKIVAVAWAERNYMGLADIPAGSYVRLTFGISAKGSAYLKSAILIQNWD